MNRENPALIHHLTSCPCAEFQMELFTFTPEKQNEEACNHDLHIITLLCHKSEK